MPLLTLPSGAVGSVGKRRTRRRVCNPVGIDDDLGGGLTYACALRREGWSVELLRSSDDGGGGLAVQGLAPLAIDYRPFGPDCCSARSVGVAVDAPRQAATYCYFFRLRAFLSPAPGLRSQGWGGVFGSGRGRRGGGR